MMTQTHKIPVAKEVYLVFNHQMEKENNYLDVITPSGVITGIGISS